MKFSTDLKPVIEAVDSLLNTKDKAMITLIGSGGKTTLLYLLAERYRTNCNVVISTTTAMRKPDQPWVSLYFNKDGMDTEKPSQAMGYFARLDQESQKVEGVDPNDLDDMYRGSDNPSTSRLSEEECKSFYNEYSEDISTLNRINKTLFLVEGDGSKGKPLKGFAPYEPVIPKETDLVLILVGADGLVQPLSEDTVHRSQLFKEITHLKDGDAIALEDVIRVISAPQGPMVKMPESAKKMIVINKVKSYLSDEDQKKLHEKADAYQAVGIDHILFVEIME